MSLAGWQPGWAGVAHKAGLHHNSLTVVIWMSVGNVFVLLRYFLLPDLGESFENVIRLYCDTCWQWMQANYFQSREVELVILQEFVCFCESYCIE